MMMMMMTMIDWLGMMMMMMMIGLTIEHHHSLHAVWDLGLRLSIPATEQSGVRELCRRGRDVHSRSDIRVIVE